MGKKSTKRQWTNDLLEKDRCGGTQDNLFYN